MQNAIKKELGQYPATLTLRLVNNTYVLTFLEKQGQSIGVENLDGEIAWQITQTKKACMQAIILTKTSSN